jgi:hypothetical protein
MGLPEDELSSATGPLGSVLVDPGSGTDPVELLEPPVVSIEAGWLVEPSESAGPPPSLGAPHPANISTTPHNIPRMPLRLALLDRGLGV